MPLLCTLLSKFYGNYTVRHPSTCHIIHPLWDTRGRWKVKRSNELIKFFFFKNIVRSGQLPINIQKSMLPCLRHNMRHGETNENAWGQHRGDEKKRASRNRHQGVDMSLQFQFLFSFHHLWSLFRLFVHYPDFASILVICMCRGKLFSKLLSGWVCRIFGWVYLCIRVIISELKQG